MHQEPRELREGGAEVWRKELLYTSRLGLSRKTDYILIFKTVCRPVYTSVAVLLVPSIPNKYPHKPDQQCVQVAGHLVREQQ